MADAYEVNVAPHNFYGHLATLMNAHFCAVVPNLRIMEIDPDTVPWYDELVTNPPEIKDGHLILSGAPRLGHRGERGGRARPPAPEAVTPADLGARARLDAAFARQERRGLMLAAAARSVAVLVIIGWARADESRAGPGLRVGARDGAVLPVTGVAQFWLLRARPGARAGALSLRRSSTRWLLAAVLVVPNPFAPVDAAPGHAAALRRTSSSSSSS